MKAAAKYLGVHTNTVRNMVGRGEAEFLPKEGVVKRGMRILLPGETSVQDLRAFARERGIRSAIYAKVSKRELADVLGVPHLAGDGIITGRGKPVRVGDKRFPSMAEVAEYFGVHKCTMTYWVATGRAVLLKRN